MIFCLEKCKYQKDGECQKSDTLTDLSASNLNLESNTSACRHFVPSNGFKSESKDFQQIKN